MKTIEEQVRERTNVTGVSKSSLGYYFAGQRDMTAASLLKVLAYLELLPDDLTK